MSTADALPAPGFADPTRDAQRAFRAVLDALAHPTRSFPLAGPADPPAALGPGLAAVALTLLDEDCAVWLGGALAGDAEVAAWLAFHTGARRANAAGRGRLRHRRPERAAAARVPGARHRRGAAPVRHGRARRPRLRTGHGCRLHRAGTRHRRHRRRSPPRGPPTASPTRGAATRRLFPRGVDLLLVDDDTVAALPRTTRLTAADPELED